MREYCFTVGCDDRTRTTRYSSRELTFIVLGDPLFPSAEDFKQALGLWDNFSVARGMNTKAWTVKSRPQLIHAAQRLADALKADGELFRYDYQWGLSAIPKQRNSAARGVGNVGGKMGGVRATPGQLYLELREKGNDEKYRIVEVRDLRQGPPVVTDEFGTIKVYRRKNTIDWGPKLSRLIDFLQVSTSEDVRIRHHYPERKGADVSACS